MFYFSRERRLFYLIILSRRGCIFVTEQVPEQEKEKMNGKRCTLLMYVPEMGFPTSDNGTITENGSASSSTGNLPV
jgi:hypothetical protein